VRSKDGNTGEDGEGEDRQLDEVGGFVSGQEFESEEREHAEGCQGGELANRAGGRCGGLGFAELNGQNVLPHGQADETDAEVGQPEGEFDWPVAGAAEKQCNEEYQSRSETQEEEFHAAYVHDDDARGAQARVGGRGGVREGG